MRESLIKCWIFFRRGMTNINFVFSLIILISVREMTTTTTIIGLAMIPVITLIGIIDYNHVQERTTPKMNPYTQDWLKSNLYQNEGMKALIKGDLELAEHCFKKSSLILNKWFEGELYEN